jgi:integral membrane protein
MNKLFRVTAFLEGLSFMILMGVCMPLKYIWGMPEAVRVVGMAHGILFVVYCLWVLWLGSVREWPMQDLFWALVASVVPCGTFFAEKKIYARLLAH